MADNIIKLKVDSDEYEGKIKRASEGLQALGRSLRDAGKTFADADAKQVEFARELGKMQTVSNTAKGKIAEMSAAFVNLKSQYLQMTDAEKQSPIGQAMSKSLEELKNRTIDAKRELEDLNKELNTMKTTETSSGGGGGGLFGGKGITDMLSVAGGNLIATGITKFTSELADTVQQSIELAKSGEGVRMAFERLNQPGLLDKLKESTHGTVSELELMKAAVKFDDFKLPVEQLGTLLEFAQKKAKDTGQSVDYMVDSIVTGLGRKSLMILDNLGLSASQVKERMAETGDMTTAVASIIKEQMSEAGEYVETAADRAAKAAADAQNQMEELGRKAMPVAEEWASVWNEIKIGGMEVLTTVLGPITDSIKNIREILSGEFTLKIKADIPNFANDDGKTVWSDWKPGKDHTVKAPGGYVEVTDKNTGAVIGGQHFDNLSDTNAITTWQKSLLKTPKAGGAKQKVPSAADFEKFIGKSALGVEGLKGSDDANFLSPYAMMLDDIKAKILDVKDADLGSALEIPDVYKQKMDEYAKGVAALKTSISTTASLVGTIGQAFGAIEDPAAKVAGTVAQAIANIALAYSDALGKTVGEKFNIWSFIAASAAAMVSMGTTIASIHQATGYAEGGIVKGNSYSGDNMMFGGDGLYGLNAGELVLTKAQQSNLANSLQSNGGNTVRVVGKIAGKDLFICAENWAKSVGKGEFVTW